VCRFYSSSVSAALILMFFYHGLSLV
jgi:hypothetical protein